MNPRGNTGLRFDSRTRMCVMYLTPAEATFILYIILTNPIVQYMSQAKPRRESNPKPVQRFPLYASLQAAAQ